MSSPSIKNTVTNEGIRMGDSRRSSSPTSPERFSRLRQRTDDSFRNDSDEAKQMLNFQEGGDIAPKRFQQRRGHIYDENSDIKDARDDFNREPRHKQLLAAQEQQEHRQEIRAEGASIGAVMRWNEGMDESELRDNGIDLNEGGYLNRNVPPELASSVRENPFASPRNESAAKQRSANASPYPHK
eukprot:GILI01006487.1.p1 GENE.GILI01006487.1~~GILI01006487.1.p1  ORF type:complete len:185 (+),score=31.85 GILI01006487.1:120-674(+)